MAKKNVAFRDARISGIGTFFWHNLNSECVMCQSLTHGFVLIRMAHQLSNNLVFTGQGYLNQGCI